MDICTLSLTGRLTRDPELKTLGSGKTVANAGFASNPTKDKTIFFDLAAWGRTGEILAEYASKGDALAIVGRLSQEEYTTKAGEDRSDFVISVDSVKLPSKSEKAPADDDIEF